MRIKLLTLDREKVGFNFSVSSLEGIRIQNLEISGIAERINEEYLIKGAYSAEIKTQCVRCLEEIKVELKENIFYAKFLGEKDYEIYLDNLNKTDEMPKDDYFRANNNEIDIIEFIREDLILNMPQYPSCIPECKDDSYLVKYSNNGMDSRWAQLLDIKIKN